ncbi:MAG: DUF418 domain-containing protein, partial [Myxococcota bacterium]|nr:DUF418 domain-containing protein [Myxococcota bacterium]
LQARRARSEPQASEVELQARRARSEPQASEVELQARRARSEPQASEVEQQLRRAGDAFPGHHLWRMGTLALIGLAHSLVWDGDILLTYALLAVLLLPLRRASERSLLRVSLAFLLLPFAAQVAAGIAAALAPATRVPLEEAFGTLLYPLQQSCFAFAAMAIGYGAGREGHAAGAVGPLPSLRPRLSWALGLALVGHALALAVMMSWQGPTLSAPGLLLAAGVALGAPALVFVYVVLALHWIGRPRARERLAPLADVGRATLTNYLLQSLFGVGLLLRTGLGPLGPVTPPVGVVLTLVVFALQVVASRWWLARFQFGPVEWLWRSVTYGAIQPLRSHRPASPGA